MLGHRTVGARLVNVALQLFHIVEPHCNVERFLFAEQFKIPSRFLSVSLERSDTGFDLRENIGESYHIRLCLGKLLLRFVLLIAKL